MSANILLLEPDAIMGRIYQTSLTKKGHVVNRFSNADAAIASIDQHLPDLVIVELQLPMHNGVEFLYEFRSYQDLVHIPVVILTNIPPMLKSFNSGFWEQLGVAAYHYKPLTKLSDLTRSIDRVLANVSA